MLEGGLSLLLSEVHQAHAVVITGELQLQALRVRHPAVTASNNAATATCAATPNDPISSPPDSDGPLLTWTDCRAGGGQGKAVRMRPRAEKIPRPIRCPSKASPLALWMGAGVRPTRLYGSGDQLDEGCVAARRGCITPAVAIPERIVAPVMGSPTSVPCGRWRRPRAGTSEVPPAVVPNGRQEAFADELADAPGRDAEGVGGFAGRRPIRMWPGCTA